MHKYLIFRLLDQGRRGRAIDIDLPSIIDARMRVKLMRERFAPTSRVRDRSMRDVYFERR